MVMEFKIGDRVRVCANAVETLKNRMLYGTHADVHKVVSFVGTIMCTGTSPNTFGIKFDGFHNGHTLDGCLHDKDKSGWYVNKRFLEHVKDNKANIQEKVIILINKNEKKVTCSYFDEDGKKHTAKAKCSPSDCFNSLVGSQIALMKLCKQMTHPLVVDKTYSLENMLLEKI